MIIGEINQVSDILMKNRYIVFFFLFLLLFQEQSFCQITIQMEQDGGVYKVPCSVNGLKLKFIFDTGASTISISSSIAKMMLDNDYLNQSDIKGVGASVIADGSIVDHTIINLRTVEIGGLVLNNVEAVVINNQDSPLLLGLSAIRKLGKVSISGNTLSIESYGSQTHSKLNYSYDELNQLYNEALKYYLDGSLILALEKLDILYRENYLLPADATMYSNCLSKDKRYQEALDVLKEAEEWTKNNHPDELRNLYYLISENAFFAEQYKMSILYGERSYPLYPGLANSYYLAFYWISSSYLEMGDLYSAKSTLEKFLMNYFKVQDISATDCWMKNYRDPTVGDAYYDISVLYPTANEGKKYCVIAAAWGNNRAIEQCNSFGWNYSSKPQEYVY